jgi:hypothetical protein
MKRRGDEKRKYQSAGEIRGILYPSNRGPNNREVYRIRAPLSVVAKSSSFSSLSQPELPHQSVGRVAEVNFLWRGAILG